MVRGRMLPPEPYILMCGSEEINGKIGGTVSVQCLHKHEVIDSQVCNMKSGMDGGVRRSVRNRLDPETRKSMTRID